MQELSCAQPILRHEVVGPYEDGIYLVVYACDHTRELTVACEARDLQNAQKEAERLNAEQLVKEEALQMERRLCGFAESVA